MFVILKLWTKKFSTYFVLFFHFNKCYHCIRKTENIMKLQEFVQKSRECGVEVTSEMVHQFEIYMQLLKEWNQKMNLTAITQEEEIIEKHFYDCILPLSVTPLKGKVADIGSGAGFPGLVWKIVCPEVEMVLVEPTGKRCTFLNTVIETLGLDHITVVNLRSEEYVVNARESFDFVSARAVANLRVLSELTIPLIRKGGMFIAMKGAKGHEEAKEAQHAMQVLGASLWKTQDVSLYSGDERVNLFYLKENSTPSIYPRNYGTIKKKPL